MTAAEAICMPPHLQQVVDRRFVAAATERGARTRDGQADLA